MTVKPAFSEGDPCAYCRRGMTKRGSRKLYPTRDHVIPKCRGGKETVRACEQCNGIKGDMTPHDWAEFMMMNPRWWTMDNAQVRRAKGLYIRHARRAIKGITIRVPPRLIYGTPDMATPPMAEPLAALKSSDG